MPSEEILHFINAIHKEKEIEIEIIFKGIEAALQIAVAKKYPNAQISINRQTGDITILSETGEVLPASDKLGRMIALSGKHTILQKIHEAESQMIFNEFNQKYHEIITGEVTRYSGNDIFLNVGKIEAMLPAEEQVLGENYRLGDRIRAYIIQVDKRGSRVRVILSRSHPQLVRKLFELEVPEIRQGLVEIKALVREAGYRTKIAVTSADEKIDPIGSCIGVRSSRIHNILEELRGEKIEIIRWNADLEIMIRNALKPAEIIKIDLNKELKKAKVWVSPEQHRIAIGKDGQNVRLAAKLCYCDIDIVAENI